MQCDQQSAAKEQGNDREQNSAASIVCPPRIRRETQIGQASHVANAQKRPKQEHGGYQDAAVKERVEIVFRQKREHAMRCERLRRPEKNWSKECSAYDDRDKIGC